MYHDVNVELESLLAAATALKFNGPTEEIHGVCCNLDVYFPIKARHLDGYSFVQHYSPSWRYYNGDRVNPVPEDYGPERFGKWEGERGTLRYDLIQHLIDTAVLEAGIY